MNWRLIETYSGWIIEYKSGAFGTWQAVNQSRHYQWEPPLPAVFSSRREAAQEMAKLVEEAAE